MNLNISLIKEFLRQIKKRRLLKIYHKSSCITCKKTITEMERMKIDIESRDFFKDPFTETELKKIIKMTGKKPQELLRKRDKTYKEMKLDQNKKTDSEIIKLMVKNPGLILRPIIIVKNKAIVGKIDPKEIKN
jgi:arsenate reductase (glutaredoxin)